MINKIKKRLKKMIAFWGDSVQLLERSLETLKSATPNLPLTFAFQGQSIATSELILSLERVIESLRSTEGTDVDAALYSIHRNGVIAQPTNIVNSVNSFISSGGVSPYSDQVLSYIWSLYSSLAWISNNKDSSKNLLSTLTRDEKTRLAELDRINKVLEKAYENLNDHQKVLKNAKQSLKDILSQVEKDALEASNAKTNAESNVLQSATSKEKFEQLIQEVEEGKLNSDKLLINLNEIKNKADITLGSASQVALASSFKIRKSGLETAQGNWIKAFLLGLFCLFSFTTISIIYSDFYHFPPIINNGSFDSWGAILRLLLASPIVWFTWFSVKQYSNNVVLIEDYAFKEASALAFVGYKKDMEDDIDMVKLLRESAIRNFAYAPSRLINSNDAASPMHELFNEAFKDKGAFDRLIEMLKALKPGKD